ncbi:MULTISPECIES: cupin domain-containing protein [unclassified Bradyrhizobium]|uniref:cupin domain-containing protein n=1 Tax=unclassified Bradyrhizobium TaxID=2631580 RepID=UPI001CD633B7|nr:MULTISPECIES: cupin domain-containing protein [unclassified Bradyrhizobium]MCA1378938.1 cupin domain-containing protein [Bradyrhizobium sp. IC4060]MCA1489015.1 cupin domain-containing protein [Bradyrhizobium sp. IC4061]
MPVFRSGEQPPAWCELMGFELVKLTGQPRAIALTAEKQRLMVTRGKCRLASAKEAQVLSEGQFWDMDGANGPFTADAGDGTGEVLIFSGRWGTELGGCGIFKLSPSTPAWAKGDPVSYPKSTNFDSHYHDCDEYWVIIEGAGTVVVGSRSFEVEAGDCVAIGMGHHHDLPQVKADLKGAYFETTLEGKKRFGHLWEHKHGPADIRAERV